MVWGAASWRRRLLKLKATLPLIKSLVVIATLFGLDIRDAVYKIWWTGPLESYHFRSGSTITLQDGPVVPGAVRGPSGWSSYLSSCASITPFCEDGSTFFLSAVLANCSTTSQTNGSVPLPSSLVITSSFRVDSAAWASCQLLYLPRRPPICQSDLVANFHGRYAFSAVDVPIEWMAPIDSAGEFELLQLLELVSLSIPQYGIICGNLFALETVEREATYYSKFIYACASTNLGRTAFLGVAHPAVDALLMDKAWLTADVVNIMNFRYGIRQNSKSGFSVRTDEKGRVLLTSHTSINFSSYGQLYVLLLSIDLCLLVVHILSSLEIMSWALMPQAREQIVKIRTSIARRKSTLSKHTSFMKALHSSRVFEGGPSVRTASTQPSLSHQPLPRSSPATDANQWLMEDHSLYSFFSRSLYRSAVVVMATCVTQLISWLLVLPNSVVWTWSDSFMQKLQAYLSSIRIWVLILLLTNGLWNLIVLVDEPAAYWFVRGTYVSSYEILVIGALMSFALRQEVFALSGLKWDMEKQRVSDVVSFPGFVAHGNTCNLELDYQIVTPHSILWLLYKPLLQIIIYSVILLFGYAGLKFLVFTYWRPLMCFVWPRSASNAAAVASSTVRASDKHQTMLLALRPYSRSEIERVMDCPVRAKSLIRNSLAMESVDASGSVHISPSCFLDFGIMLRDGEVRTRICFANILSSIRRPTEPFAAALQTHSANFDRIWSSYSGRSLPQPMRFEQDGQCKEAEADLDMDQAAKVVLIRQRTNSGFE